MAYAASSFFIGVAGGVYAYFLTFLNPVGSFAILGSVMIVLAALVGGRGTLYGPVVGAFIVGIGSETATVYGGSSSRVLHLRPGPDPHRAVPARRPAARRSRRRGASWRPVDDRVHRPGRARSGPGPMQVRDRALAAPRSPTRSRPRRDLRDEPLLEVKGASKRFGGLVAVDGADLVVQQGTITALIGPNGSGKTTLFNLVTGAMKADTGEVWLDGTRIDRMQPWQRGHLGLARTFQTTRLFKSMTVLENLVAPLPDARWSHDAQPSRRRRTRPTAPASCSRSSAWSVRRPAAPAPCPTASRSWSSWPRCSCSSRGWCCSTSPPAASTPAWSAGWSRSCATSTRQGVTFLVVEHNIPMVLELCDPVVVFSPRQGRSPRGRRRPSARTRSCSTPTWATSGGRRSSTGEPAQPDRPQGVR